MRTILGLSTLALLAAAPALAQPQYYPQPRGSYERLCRDIRMDGQMLSAFCRGARGSANSSINVLSCGGDISVDATGGLTCLGPGVAPPPYADTRPGYIPPANEPGWAQPGRPGGWRGTAILFGARGWRGPSIRIDGPTPNLADLGINDRVRSIRLERRSGPWIICSDANYGGRCETVRGSLIDTNQIGMRDSISSLRPAY